MKLRQIYLILLFLFSNTCKTNAAWETCGLANQETTSVCLGYKDGQPSFIDHGNLATGCLGPKDGSGCEISVKGILSGIINGTQYVFWEMKVADGDAKTMLSINEHRKGFDPETDYFFVEAEKRGSSLAQKHFIHSTGPFKNESKNIPCQFEKGEDREFVLFNDVKTCPIPVHERIGNYGSTITFQTKSKMYYEVSEGILRPYIDYIKNPLRIHMQVIRNGKVTVAPIFVNPYWLFDGVNPANNPLRYLKASERKPCEFLPNGDCIKHIMLNLPEPQSSCKSPNDGPLWPPQPVNPSDGENNNSKTTTVIIVVVVVFLLLLVILLLILLCQNRKESKSTQKLRPQRSKSDSSVRSKINVA